MKAKHPTSLLLNPTRLAQVAAGWKHSLGVGAGGRLWAWGWGGSQGSASAAFPGHASEGGQLGVGDEFDYHRPTRVRALQLPNGRLLPQVRRAPSSAFLFYAQSWVGHLLFGFPGHACEADQLAGVTSPT